MMHLSIGHRRPRAYGRDVPELELELARLDKRELARQSARAHVGLDLDRDPWCGTPATEASVAGCSSCQASAYRKAQKTAARVGGLFGPDIKASGDELVTVLQEAVNKLSADIGQDACGDFYTAACKGTSPAVDALEQKLADAEAKGDALDAASILTLAGVEPTAANVAAFGACVKTREDATAAVPRGTLAYCAIAVRDKTAPGAPLLPKAHSSQTFRDRFATFVASFERFVSQYETATSAALGDATALQPALEKQLSQYNSYRSQFIDAGGQTSAPSVGEPLSWPATIAVGAGIAGALYLLAQLLLRKYVG